MSNHDSRRPSSVKTVHKRLGKLACIAVGGRGWNNQPSPADNELPFAIYAASSSSLFTSHPRLPRFGWARKLRTLNDPNLLNKSRHRQGFGCTPGQVSVSSVDMD
ncbi:predicted protein [Histoplasma capsulatum H143]|uniref:Uncharacterized protein n=1 Tax=Ajellomyces capsulatus (strain H143) TaxID=544712 RepID=C6H264_AJECH|nr:predicted protein [Histoplasma capsulatum H143]